MQSDAELRDLLRRERSIAVWIQLGRAA